MNFPISIGLSSHHGPRCESVQTDECERCGCELGPLETDICDDCLEERKAQREEFYRAFADAAGVSLTEAKSIMRQIAQVEGFYLIDEASEGAEAGAEWGRAWKERDAR